VPTLFVLVDFDNVGLNVRRAGAVACARILIQKIPVGVLSTYDSITVRHYGGWRSNGTATQAAQQLVPDIVRDSPTVISLMQPTGQSNKKITVELAIGPIGTSIVLSETLVRDRNLRRFRANAGRLRNCLNVANCGLGGFFALRSTTNCSDAACDMTLGDMLVRDEQKMVDTLVVADMAYLATVQRAVDLVVVSSDTDMWPGTLLAAAAGCRVIHIHTKAGWQTQQFLLQTLVGLSGQYLQVPA